MFNKLSRILQQPIYLWLVGIFPILHLYSENLGLVKDHEVLYVCAMILAATTLGFIVTNQVFRWRYKTAFILSICSLVFSFSGHVYVLTFMPRSLFLWSLFLMIALGILLFRLWKIDLRDFYWRVTPTFNLISLALLLIPCTKIISSHVTQSISLQSALAFEPVNASTRATPKVHDSSTHPDIYYIIPDGYPSDSWLLEAMNYDNSAFTKALRDRGFIVVDHAQSNYALTLLSLASTVNMQHYGRNRSSFVDLDYLRITQLLDFC